MSSPESPTLTALHAVARAALRYRDRTGTQGVLSEALDHLTASGWRPDGPESEAPPTPPPNPATSLSRAIRTRAAANLLAHVVELDAAIVGYADFVLLATACWRISIEPNSQPKDPK